MINTLKWSIKICKFPYHFETQRMKNEGSGESKGYPEDWLREVVKNRPDQFLLDENE